MRKIIYDYNEIQKALNNLNSIKITGIDNCKRVALISMILQNPIVVEEEITDGNNKECKSIKAD